MNELTGSSLFSAAKSMILSLASANCSLILPFATVLFIFFNLFSELLKRE